MNKPVTKQKKPKFDYNVYVACSLTHAPVEFRADVEAFKKELKYICNVLSFVGLSDDSPYETYLWDIHECVHKSDLIFAICDFPAIGLGYEIATQVEVRRKPCIAVAHDKALVTKLILDTRQPNFEFRRYKNLQKDGLKMVEDKLQEIQNADMIKKIEKAKKPRQAVTKVK